MCILAFHLCVMSSVFAEIAVSNDDFTVLRERATSSATIDFLSKERIYDSLFAQDESFLLAANSEDENGAKQEQARRETVEGLKLDQLFFDDVPIEDDLAEEEEEFGFLSDLSWSGYIKNETAYR